MKANRVRVLAISSGGGHWVQLLRLSPAWAGCMVVYATVANEYRVDLPAGTRFALVPDATRWDRVRFVRMLLAVIWLLLRYRPTVVVTTGAAPGYAAARLARFLGAKTVWVDSIANADELSLSGRKIGKHVDLWLTQWPHLAERGGPRYLGSVL